MSVIKISAEIKNSLDKRKVHQRETYQQVIERLLLDTQKHKPKKGS
ncbi:MAG: hypothetical protein KIS30_09860 [Thermoplasmata archaeon]|nr:hypothetical protein [Candidatus Sysuiplasma acidicola]MBX8647039.1 hypothetical protein [Candidatus Sysuiplasma acidicola]